VLAGVDGVVSVDVDAQNGALAIELSSRITAEEGSGRVLGALLAADVAVLSFDMEAGRLSEAYLELTARP